MASFQRLLLQKISDLGRDKSRVFRRGSSLAQNMAETCKAGRQRFREVKPREHKQILAAEVRELFHTNAMVAVLSYFDMKNAEWSELICEMSKCNIHFRFLPNKIVHRALDNTPYVNICPLFLSANVVAYSEDLQVKGLLDALKSQRKVQLLGGKVHDNLFAVDGFQWISKLPTLEELYSELVAILSHPSLNITQMLMRNPQILSTNLEMLARENSE